MYIDMKRSLGYIVKWGRRGNLHVTVEKHLEDCHNVPHCHNAITCREGRETGEG